MSPEQRAAAYEAWSANHRPTPPYPTTPSAAKLCTKAVVTDACPSVSVAYGVDGAAAETDIISMTTLSFVLRR